MVPKVVRRKMIVLENNIKKDLEDFGKDGDHRVISDFKRVLSAYPEDKDFIISIFTIVIDKMEDMKQESMDLNSQIIGLKNDIEVLQNDLWDYRAERWIPNERFFILRDNKTNEQKKVYITKEMKKNIDNIYDYIVDVEGDICIFEWGERVHRADLKFIAKELPNVRKVKLKKTEKIPDLETLIKHTRESKIVTDEMLKIWNVLIESKEKNLSRTALEISDMAEVSKQTAHTHLKFFADKKWVKKSGPRYSLEDFD